MPAPRGGGSTAASRSATPTSAFCARASPSTRWTSRASTSARAPARSSRAPTRGRAGARSRATCPPSRRSTSRPSMPELHLPPTLPSLYSDLPRRLDVDAATVDEAISRLEERWPGLRDRLCEPGPTLRRHINVYVDRERAGLDTPLEPGSRVDVIAAISGG